MYETNLLLPHLSYTYFRLIFFYVTSYITLLAKYKITCLGKLSSRTFLKVTKLIPRKQTLSNNNLHTLT